MENLNELYWINSPSGQENGLSGYVSKLLFEMGIDFDQDEYLQIYSLNNPKMPIICSHLDQVGNMPISKLITKNGIITGDKNIGADDKNGIWICLQLIKLFPDINFIFSTCEEIGGNIQEILQENDISNFPYCLVFDRKGRGDIIGHKNNYCSLDFEAAISEVGKLYGYKPAQGIYSDCNIISEYVNCVNLSCGYYNAHTDKEYTVISELKNALEFAIAIIQDETVNSQIWENENYCISDKWDTWDDEPLNMDGIPACPYCHSELIDFVENKQDGFLCPDCQYEYILDYDYKGWY